MLQKFWARGFKSLRDVSISFENFTAIVGTNAAGKSNLLDAIQILSGLSSERTISDALEGPVRGNPLEMFSFDSEGMSGLFNREYSDFTLGAIIDWGATSRYRYEVTIRIEPKTGALTVSNEELQTLKKRTEEPAGVPRISKEDERLKIPSRQGRPRMEDLYQNHTKLSDTRLASSQFQAIANCRNEMMSWQVYYLDPRISMRQQKPPSQVSDIGINGEDLLPFLFRIKIERPRTFSQLQRTLRAIIPGVSDLDVVLDERRGLIEGYINQGGVQFSFRVASEGTLRVIALAAIVSNPWGKSLVAIEEPENGVQPQRVELVSSLLMSISSSERQVIVTSHSPLFCSSALKTAQEKKKEIGIWIATNSQNQTQFKKIDTGTPLFTNVDIDKALEHPDEATALRYLLESGAIDA